MFVKLLLPVTLSKRWLYCGLKPHHPRRMQRHQHPEVVSLKSSIGRPPFSCWSWPGVMPRFDLAREGVSSNCTNSPPREIFGKTGRDGGVRRGQGWSSAPGGLVEWSGAGVGVGLLRLVDKTFPFPKLSLLAFISRLGPPLFVLPSGLETDATQCWCDVAGKKNELRVLRPESAGVFPRLCYNNYCGTIHPSKFSATTARPDTTYYLLQPLRTTNNNLSSTAKFLMIDLGYSRDGRVEHCSAGSEGPRSKRTCDREACADTRRKKKATMPRLLRDGVVVAVDRGRPSR